MPAVIVAGIGNIELPHELGQVGLGRLNDQMKMVAHKHIGVHADTRSSIDAPWFPHIRRLKY